VQRLIECEMMARFDYLGFEDETRRRILRLVGDLGQYDRKVLERVIIQVEALFVFAILKSALAS
jgi:hypothetical protein